MTEPRLLDTLPAARFWIEAGVGLGPAAKLVRAGYSSLASLAGVSRGDLLAIAGVGAVTVELCERLLGHRLPSVFGYWRDHGLPPKLSQSLAAAGLESLEELARLTPKELSAIGVGASSRVLCQALLAKHASAQPRPAPDSSPLATQDPGVDPGLVRELQALHQRILEKLLALRPRRDGAPATAPLQLALWNAARALERVTGEPPEGLDLTVDDPAAGEALYEWVVRHHFALRVLDDPGDVLVSGSTPEESQLRVFFEHGRWFASWIKLEVEESKPESLRRELILFETGEQGELVETVV